MANWTTDQKIQWVRNRLDFLENAISEEQDQGHKEWLMSDRDFFYAVLDDLYGIRLWNSLHKSDSFEVNSIPMSMN